MPLLRPCLDSHPFLGIRSLIILETAYQRLWIIRYQKHLPVLTLHKALGDGVVQKGEKCVEIAGNVDKATWFTVKPELCPCHEFGYFLKRPESAWQCNERIGEIKHHCFPLVHRINDVQFGQPLMRYFVRK